MRFVLRSGGRIEFSDNAIAILQQYVQCDSHAPEAGGVLLGRMMENCNDIIIDDVTAPGGPDKRRRYFFFRSKKRTQELVNRAWFESKGTRNYLGEWHSHPEEIPTPSCIDKKNWIHIAKTAKYESPILIFVIVGLREIRVWELSRDDRHPTLLQGC